MLKLFRKKHKPEHNFIAFTVYQIEIAITQMIKKDKGDGHKNIDNIEFYTQCIIDRLRVEVKRKFDHNPQLLKEVVKSTFKLYLFNEYHIGG